MDDACNLSFNSLALHWRGTARHFDSNGLRMMNEMGNGCVWRTSDPRVTLGLVFFFFGLHKDRDDGAFLILRLCDGGAVVF